MPFPIYAFSEFGGGQPAEMKLHSQIVAGGPYTTNFLGVSVDWTALTCAVLFDAPPSGANQATIDAIVAAHNGVETVMPQSTLSLIVEFGALGAGADDVIIYNENAPYNFRILDSYVYVAGAVALATLQLRSALGGGGGALSDAWSGAVLSVIRNVLLSAPPTILVGQSLVLRRSSANVAGFVVIVIQRV